MKCEKLLTAISVIASCLVLPVAGAVILFNDLEPVASVPVVEYESIVEPTVTSLTTVETTTTTLSTTVSTTTTITTTRVEETTQSTQSTEILSECEPEFTYSETIEEVSDVIIEDTSEDTGSELEFQGFFEATWYTAVDMGYTSTPFGYYNRDLVSGYSIASNTIPGGSLIQVVGGGLDGVYRVDDIGYMGDSVIDFYYWDRSCIPEYFRTMGRVDIEIYIIEVGLG